MVRFLLIFLLTAVVYQFANAQVDDKVDVFIKVANRAETQNCRELKLGSPVESATPVYPAEARSLRLGGAVRVELIVDKEGNVAEILNISGDELLTAAAREAAMKTKFAPSHCGKQAIESAGILIFNFVPLALTDLYSVPERAAGFADIDRQSSYYESVLSLTENYKLAFGYADGGFHADAPLTKGEFAHFLRLTLDLLQNRAEIARKIPREIELYFPFNPLGLSSSSDISDLDSRRPYYKSVAFLISKYDIALIDEKREFRGDLPIGRTDVMEYWKKIFGEDAIPVNFAESADTGQTMSRGQFALFLHESLYVLTYKVLP